MCGLFGLFHRGPGHSNASEMAKKMLRGLHHRGPDQQAIKTIQNSYGELILGHTRLAILDVSHGQQPMISQNHNNVIVYNGEVYNTDELKKILRQHNGPTLRTTCDTELLLELMTVQPATQVIDQLNGMFAFVLWDERNRQIILARDRFGIKPLFYHINAKGELFFSSELNNLLIHPSVPKTFSRQGLEQYFFQGHAQAPYTVLENVFQLSPGEMLVWNMTDGSYSKHFYFQRPTKNGQDKDLTFSEGKIQLRKKIAKAVQSQLVSDVPIGMFLSGGIDSSVIAYEASLKGPIKTFAMAFEDPSFNESAYARQMAKTLGAQHYEFLVDNSTMQSHLPEILRSIQNPFADYSIIPSWILAKHTREHVTVALGGDGGDELLGGYPTYKAHHLIKKIPSWMIELLAPLALALPRIDQYQSLEWKLKRLLGRYQSSMPWRHLNWLSLISEIEMGDLFVDQRPLSKNFWTEIFQSHNIQEKINDMLYLDRINYMPGEVLAKVDTASMANSLEVRPPFLDNNLAIWCDHLPLDWKVHGTKGKWILKESYRGLIPDDILFRAKHGFSVPLAQWMMGPLGPWCKEALSDQLFFDKTRLRRQFFKDRWHYHKQGASDHSRELWALIVLHQWSRNCGILC